MTKVGRLIFEEGLAEGERRGEKRGEKRGEEREKKRQRIIAVANMLDLDIPEQKILEKYSQEELKAAKEALEQKI